MAVHLNDRGTRRDLVRTWSRMHTNGLAATVNQYRSASVRGQGCCGAHKARGTRGIGVASSAKAALAIVTLADSYRTTVTSWYKRLRTSARPRGRRRLPSVSAPSAYRW